MWRARPGYSAGRMVSRRQRPCASANWCPRQRKPLLSYSPNASEYKKCSGAFAAGLQLADRTRPETTSGADFSLFSSSDFLSGESGLKTGPAVWRAVCLPHDGVSGALCARSVPGRREPAAAASRRRRRREVILLALDAQQLLQRVHHLHQVRLVGHDLVDVLVGAGDLVDHAAVLAANHALSLQLEIFRRETALRFIPAHSPAGAVRAGLKALRRALPPDDVAARAHAAGDDTKLARPGADRALARQPDALAVMNLALDVIVVAVDRRAGDLEGRQVPAQRVEREVHHLGAVRGRVILRPADRLDVVVEMRRAFGKVGQVRVGQVDVVFLKIFFCERNEVGADRVPDAAP